MSEPTSNKEKHVRDTSTTSVASRPLPSDPWQAYAELGRIPLHDLPLGEVLQRVAALAQASVPGADDVSVTLVEKGKAASVAFTGQLAPHLDERQYQDGFGPCLEAARTGTTVVLNDLRTQRAYPDFVAAADRAGVTATLSVGMPVPDRVVGGLNMYSVSQTDFSEEAIQAAEVFASYAAVALANASAMTANAQLAGHLRKAMETRAPIEHAIGVLIADHGFAADEAFQHLAERSQHTNRKVRDIALEVVETARQRHRTPPERHPDSGA
jgi:GAF domain-containing protein